jgi:hypothetical protein
MKLHGAWIQSALAAAGLIAAYVTWQRPAEQTDAEVVVLDVARPTVERLRYEDDRRVVEVIPGREGTWIRHTEKPPPPPPPPPVAVADGGTVSDGGTGAIASGASDAGMHGKSILASGAGDAGTSARADVAPAVVAPPPAPKTREYRANESTDRLMEKFAPLRAVRALGVLPAEKLQEMGLADAKRILEVVTTSGTHRFKVAGEALGMGSPYAMDVRDGRVYVLRGTLLSDLEFASNRLVDRRLHAFGDREFDGVVVRSGDKERRLVKAGDKLAAAPQQPVDEFATNWHERIWRTMGIDVLGRGEMPAAGTPKVELRVDYVRGNAPVGFIEMGKVGSDVFARTEHTAGWVRLHAGSAQILDERQKVVDPRG